MHTDELYQIGKYFDVGDVIEVSLEADLGFVAGYIGEQLKLRTLQRVVTKNGHVRVEVTNYKPQGNGLLEIEGRMEDNYECRFNLRDVTNLRVLGHSFDELD